MEPGHTVASAWQFQDPEAIEMDDWQRMVLETQLEILAELKEIRRLLERQAGG